MCAHGALLPSQIAPAGRHTEEEPPEVVAHMEKERAFYDLLARQDPPLFIHEVMQVSRPLDKSWPATILTPMHSFCFDQSRHAVIPMM